MLPSSVRNLQILRAGRGSVYNRGVYRNAPTCEPYSRLGQHEQRVRARCTRSTKKNEFVAIPRCTVCVIQSPTHIPLGYGCTETVRKPLVCRYGTGYRWITGWPGHGVSHPENNDDEGEEDEEEEEEDEEEEEEEGMDDGSENEDVE